MNNNFNSEKILNDFPLLKQIAYLDNAATSLTPKSVINAMDEYYLEYGANVHRGIHQASEKATAAFEATRMKVQQLINAEHVEEIIFTSGTTHSLNMTARMLTEKLKTGDEIILTELEHHANIIPWQIVAKEKGLHIKYLTLNDQGEIDPVQLNELINKKTKILSVAHVSNVSGYELPIAELIKQAKKNGLYTVIDGAQSLPHFPVDIQKLDADFMVFSAHKMCGPTGVGVLYGKKELLEQLNPPFGGGSMIDQVEMQSCSWAGLPHKFEPGTPNIAGVIGFGAAINYLQQIGLNQIHKQVSKLNRYAIKLLNEIDKLTIHGPAETYNGIISFSVKNLHPHDIAAILDQENVAVRAGHHCAQPLMKRWNVPATTRVSLYFYNTKQEIDQLTVGLNKAITTLQ